MLFDLSNDPAEQQNIIAERPMLVGYYRQLMQTVSNQPSAELSINKVDMNNQSDEVIQNLRELGYIK